MAKTLFNISDKIVAGDTSGDFLAFRNRVLADGGTIETTAETEAEIRRLHDLGLYDDDLTLAYVAGAYKAGKWYNIKGASGDLDVVRATNGTRQNRAGVIDTLGNNITRADYDAGVLKGNWVERAATNLVLRSEEFDNATWAKAGGGTGTAPVVTANAATAPDGTMTADLIVFDRGAGNTSSDRSRIDQIGASNTIGAMYNGGLYIKASAPSEIGKQIAMRVATNENYSVYTLTGDWQRINKANNADVVGLYMGLDIRGGITNDNQVSCHIWGAQFETGSTASTYIKTTGSTATRNADNISKTGISGLIGQTEGVIYAEINLTKLLGAITREIFAVRATANNIVILFFTSEAPNRLRAVTIEGGSVIRSNYFTISNTGIIRCALKYSTEGQKFFVNGSDESVIQTNLPSTGFTTPLSATQVGVNAVGTLQLNDPIYSAYHWKTAKTDAQLIQLTTL